ncbi:MAG: isoprenoid biosynthesis glyoxalase ElbB [Bacteroidales bacterium]|nr:isoprenoid biosynthesis glyoxalase ElbB [Bacteroidales bacterium]
MSGKKKIAVILSGCGVYDGAEIHEATLTLYSIKKNGAEYEIYAPDMLQHHVINHITGNEMKESRNVLIESARIARGAIKPLAEFEAGRVDAVIFPGGFGAAKNLSDFAFKGANCMVNDDVANLIRSMVTLNKPVGLLCIAPVLAAKVLGPVKLTIGEDAGTFTAVKKMGAEHVVTTHGEVIIDQKYKIVSTPCYMLDADIVQIAEGAENLVKAILNMMH